MVGGDTALQFLTMQRCGKASRVLQLAAMARPAERCSSLLWRGWQRVVARYCGNGQQRCNSWRWPTALQLAVLGRQCCNSRRWPIARCNPGQRCVGAFLFFFVFFLLDNFKSERERDRKRKGGRTFETCSKISTLLVGRNVTRKLLLVLTQAPSASSNTNTLRLRQQ